MCSSDLGTHKQKDPCQMTDRERRYDEYKRSHSEIDLDSLKDLERSMMLRILVFLLRGPHTTREIYNEGQFYRCSNLMDKLRRLQDMGLITMEPQRKHRMVALTAEGRGFANYLYVLMRFLRKHKR